MSKKILVIGSGGREHAICHKFSQSPTKPIIYALPGNIGMKSCANLVENIEITNHQAIIDFCKINKIDFVFIGPEQPLVNGLVDDLQKNKIRVFGPSKEASKLEGSKVFMKKIAQDNHVPTAKYASFTSAKPAIEFIEKLGFPAVIKTDGLASGKGVLIPQNLTEAIQNIEEIFAGKFGKAGNEIVIEEFLNGYEVSYFVICDGKNFLPLGFAHDHKKIFDGEIGLNTGGMGAFSPSNLVDKNLENKIIQQIIIPTLKGLQNKNAEFLGILFAGLMIVNNEPKLLEFNIRFGDPETQVILPRIKTDFVEIIENAIDKKLHNFKIEFDENKKTICVVMSSKGYPENYEKNTQIKNLKNVEDSLKDKSFLENHNLDEVQIFHAGTSLLNNEYIAIGGRVLNIVASANNFEKARNDAYKIVKKIDWNEGYYRTDIGIKALFKN